MKLLTKEIREQLLAQWPRTGQGQRHQGRKRLSAVVKLFYPAGTRPGF